MASCFIFSVRFYCLLGFLVTLVLIELNKMKYSTVTLLSSLLYGATHASLYGESNLNHTCQLRTFSSHFHYIMFWVLIVVL